MKSVQEMKALLKDLDLNGDGFVTTAEVRSLMGEDYDEEDEEFFEIVGLNIADDDDKVKIAKVEGRYSKTQKIRNNTECVLQNSSKSWKVWATHMARSRSSINCLTFSMRMEMESFLELKPRLVLKESKCGRVAWTKSLTN